MFARLRRKPQAVITIVSGLPRSGTSLMMQMLHAGGFPLLTDGRRSADEHNPRGYFEFDAARRIISGDTDWLNQASGQAVKIVAPHLPHLPNRYRYRVVFMQRKLQEIVASQLAMTTSAEHQIQVGDEVLTREYLEHLIAVNRWVDQQSNIRRLDVNYNTLIDNPAPWIRSLQAFLDHPLNTDAMLQAIEPSLYRQRY